MSVEVSTLSQKELQKLIKAATARKQLLEKRAPQMAVRKMILAYARSEGYSIEELFGLSERAPKLAQGAVRGPSKFKGVKLPILYRHPEDKSLTWTGRGQQPRWLSELLASGHELGEFKLKKVYKKS